MTGDDIMSAFDIIEENGGVGDWESDEAQLIDRYDFPRFPGADKHGTCSTKGKTHAGNHDKNTKCRDFTPDPGNMYLSRSGIDGHDTDVETLVEWLEAPRTVVGLITLLGEPGTGKTALVEAAVTHLGRNLITHLCTPDDTRESLFLRFVGEGNGENGSPYVKGVIPTAAETGAVLYMDEYMLLTDGVKPITYELADGRRFLSGGNVDGSALEIHPDFRLIISSNPLVRGASLPEPVASRCASTTLTVETDASLLRSLGVDDSIVEAWRALATSGLWQPQIREMRMADYWLSKGRLTQAVSAFTPEHCPESQRVAVRDVAVGFLSGDIREDGRLVVR